MSKKDYELIARGLRSVDIPFGASSSAVRTTFALKFAEVLGRDNTRFDRERFLLAAIPQLERPGVPDA